MLKIGLTGGIGSGKTTVTKCFIKLGVPIIDSDVIVNNLLKTDSQSYKKIIKHFGKEVLNRNQKLDRKKLRKIIFNDANAKKWLEGLLHPLVYKTINKQLSKITYPYCIVVIPLLIEKNLYHLVDRILVVDTKISDQIKRIVKRDKVRPIDVKAIIKNQASRTLRLKLANDIIRNTESLQKLIAHVKKLDQKYLNQI